MVQRRARTGLSRLESWVGLGGREDALLRGHTSALSSTLRNFASTVNDTLCRGRPVNVELLLPFARDNDEPAFQLEVNVHG